MNGYIYIKIHKIYAFNEKKGYFYKLLFRKLIFYMQINHFTIYT